LVLEILEKKGRGTCEHFNIPVTEIDILTGNLELITGSVGGFCCGAKNIIFHQRLNSSGYVYSASLPPLLASHSHTALDMLDENPEIIATFHDNLHFFNSGLRSISGIKIRSSPLSPVIHLELSNSPNDKYENEKLLQVIVDESLKEGILLTRAKYSLDEKFLPPPSIRICISAANKKEHLEKAIDIIKKATAIVTSGFDLPPITPSSSTGSNSTLFKRSVSTANF